MSAMGSRGFVLRRALRIACWLLIILIAAYAGVVIYAYPHDHEQHISAAAAAKIASQSITARVVEGSDLPPVPDPSGADATVVGIDANQNGIRDDVELAIFSEYPTSSATSSTTRAAELQYAMDLQTMLTEVFDTNTWQAAMVQRERGFGCLYDSTSTGYSSLEKEVDQLVLNTGVRTQQFDSIQQYAVAYKLASGPDCDLSRE